VSEAAQKLIQDVRAALSKEHYSEAAVLLRNAPADRASWTPHERDEVLCLEEFLKNLDSPLRV
jgi:hypothetical protein